MLRQIRLACVWVGLQLAIVGTVAYAAEPNAAQLEFFETRIRPVLVEHCYECHNSAKRADGGLAVDERAALLEGGDRGAVIVPGKPQESRLLPILRHEVDKLKMPQGRGRLEARVIADFEKWIELGAPDPRDKPPSVEDIERQTSWEGILEKRRQWWSFQPIKRPVPPVVPDNEWSQHPIDRFILANLRENNLKPAAPAEPATLVRRLYFSLIGLPPTADEAERWARQLKQPGGYEELVDHLLASPHFGERWARHWMDWIRYAESHGSEGDPAIDNAWLYRDYLIRALNRDVPYNLLVREHVAGDLLEQPRIEHNIVESMIGPAHWRMVFHGFAPTDALDEKVRFIDDEINTFSKAFLGLTVSCARCHDHKFDPISQRDYYALFGILGSCRLGRNAIDAPHVLDAYRQSLAAKKSEIRGAVSAVWLEVAPRLKQKLLADDGLWSQARSPNFVLHPWFLMRKATKENVPFATAWQQQVDNWKTDRQQRDEHAQRKYWQSWNLSIPADYLMWNPHGNGLPEKPFPAGEFSIQTTGDNGLAGIYPSGVYSNSLSAKHVARLSSGTLHLKDNYDLWLRVIGDGGATARYVVYDYPRNGTVFPVTPIPKDWQWLKFDMSYWNGDDVHVELTSGRDAPLMVTAEPRSWFGIREAVIVKKGDPTPPAESRELLDPLFEAAGQSVPESFEMLADQYVATVTAAVKAWERGIVTDQQSLLLDACLQQGLLPNRLEDLGKAEPLIVAYRDQEAQIIVPTRVPGLEEVGGEDQALFDRGNHKQPKEIVPRRFLEVIDPKPYNAPLSGRRQLAEDLVRDDNPLTRRVIVNRLWHHLFGRGIVGTPDNFGRLGQLPTHPELLDHLATYFQEQGWSIKQTIRYIVLSKTWQLDSRPTAESAKSDPDNLLWSHSQLRRLEAEAIRDALLTVSGRLSRDMYGGPVDGASNRRSVYVRVNRNSLDPFLRAFDFPEPFAAVGRRDVTNVPAQSLTLMNDERVAALAAAWAGKILADPKLSTDEARLQAMTVSAFARPATLADIERLKVYLTETRTGYSKLAEQVAEMKERIQRHNSAVRKLMDPVRDQLLAAAKSKMAAGEQLVPQPIGRWEFESDLKDQIGTSHGEARGGAKLDGGALLVQQQGHVITAPLKKTLKAKTLEAWVQLDTLEQSGGGVMTIQSPDGVVFDSIVFAEQSPRQWMAGSNFFARTQSFNGSQEQDAATRAVHVAIAYHEDGKIAGYRDGQPYGKPYHSNGPFEFKAGESIVSFGLRHLPAGGNRMLSGRILRAQLYDRALSADEIQATANSAPYFVNEAQVLAALTPEQRDQVAINRKQIQDLERQISALGAIPETIDDKVLWTEIARALFTFQEFIYLK